MRVEDEQAKLMYQKAIEDRLWQLDQLVKSYMPVGLHVQAWTLSKEVRDGIRALQRQHERDVDEIRKAHEKEVALIGERARYE